MDSTHDIRLLKGRLIVIEGTDGSGKATQAGLLCEKLSRLGLDPYAASFPRYGNPMAKGVEFYLSGKYGTDAESVSPYMASIMYAVDRADAANTEIIPAMKAGRPIVADRYTTSNALHQTEKIKPVSRHAFLNWLYDLEYKKLGIPEPDLVIYLDVDPDVAYRYIKSRTGKPGVKNDIHERNADYLRRVRESAIDTIEYSGWDLIRCTENGEYLPPETIHRLILERIFEKFRKEKESQCPIRLTTDT